MAMQLACLACGATLCERLDAQSLSGALENERNHAADGAALSASAETDAASEPTQADQQPDNRVTRCTRCDGSFHSPCVLKLGSPEPFECARCLAGGSDTSADDDEEDDDDEIDLKMPLLVPLQALAYLRPEWKAMLDVGAMKETAAAPAETKIKPKTSQMEPNETVKQARAEASTQDQANLLSDHVATSVDGVANGPAILENVTLIICDGCDLELDIATLDPPLAEIPEGDWFCSSCSAKKETSKPEIVEPAIVQAEVENVTLIICDGCDVEYDIATLNPPLAEIPEGDWFCLPCKEKANANKSEPEVIASAQPVANTVSVFMCDCCELEYDRATLDPPLTENIEDDWFCRPCIVKAKKSKKRPKRKIHKDPVAALRAEQRRAELKQLPAPAVLVQAPVVVAAREELITILICDGCDAEFDAAQIVPKLRRIPKGDWYCHACKANKITKQSPSAVSTPAPTVLESSEKSRRRKPPAIAPPPPRLTVVDRAQKDNTTEDSSSRRPSPSMKRKRESGSSKKNKQPEAVVLPEKSVSSHAAPVKDTFPQVFFAPQAVSVVRNSSREDDSMNGSTIVAPGTCLLSEDEGDNGDDDDDVVIVCDICMGEFKMVETLKEGASRGVPPRPWYCTRCLKSLKKTRKKRQRISKQMMLEMQIYGGLLRATAEKTVDPETASLRGRPPSSLEETKQMHAIVGQRVGIFFKWDKHWVMGRVVKYLGEQADHRHLVRFDDETEQILPLYAFPMVIGTQTMLYVKVPAMQSQWWPAHLLRMNAKAKKLLLRTSEQEEATMRNFHLVSLFAESSRAGKPQHVSCWVPKYLCRSARSFSPPNLDSGMVSDFLSALKRSEAEKLQQQVILSGSMQSLLQQLNDKQWSHIAKNIVGKDIIVLRRDQQEGEAKEKCFRVMDYNVERDEHELAQEGTTLWLDLRKDETRFLFANASDYGEWAVSVETTANSANNDDDEHDTSSSKEGVAKADELVPLASSEDEAATSSGVKSCSVCLLSELISGDRAKKPEAMVECAHCSSSYHLVCCDPPYDPFSLRNDEDGAVLIEDTKAPFVCHQCTTCAGCRTALLSKEDAQETGSTQNPTEWVQWRLRLQSVSLCGSCVSAYGEDRYCSVCHLVLNDEEHVSNLDLLSCSSCHLWVHAKCEPDPNPAFHRDHDAQFDLDVVLECLQLKQLENEIEQQAVDTAVVDTTATTEMDSIEKDTADTEITASVSTTAPKSLWNEEFRPSRMVDEEMSLSMKFDERYNPKILNNYECFTCRKVRMLRVIHRLMHEDKLELFKEPVTKNIAPTYFDVIKSPMDLSTMQRKVLSDAYPLVNFAGFRDDFELVCLNAVTFNSKERDFLVWREAWRFYGQGQRIFRQIAPKSRMKHRGGKSYDALAVAAKRQLPSNSVMFGKNQDGDSNDSMFPDENDLVQDGEHATTKEADGKLQSNSIETVDSADQTNDRGTELVDIEKDVKVSSHEDAAAIPSTGDVSVSENNAVVATNEISEHRRPANGEASTHASSALVLQKELGETPRPECRMDLIRILQSRPIAHTYCWMDMCARCGSAGLRSKMIFCIDCGEAFHSFCVEGMTEERLADNEALKMFWRCTNCKMCELCGKPGGDSNAIDRLHFCGCCDRGYHGFCLTPAITTFDDEETKSKGKSSSQRSISSTMYCASCVSCSNCGQHPREGGYSYDRRMCLPCSSTKRSDESIMKERSKSLSHIWTADARKQKRDAERCPMCDQKWSAEDHELMQCDVCERWAHPKCDMLLTEEPERYRVLVEDPSAAYICGVCRPKERPYLSNVPHSWKCQILISKIQEKRRECHGQWRESRTQLAQSRQWQLWRENTPVFLYVLRLGEECLKNLAYRSVNFQENWYRFTKEQELVEKGVVVPNWLVQKASRYLRFKRYARGPKAARRRHARKQSTFYSQQGVEKHPEASAICTIVSEASSCAALLACVNLFYGWRPLSKVVLHLLEQDEIDVRGCRQPPLSEALLNFIRIDDSKTLEDEIAMIKTQYERRVGKRHLARESGTDTDQVMADAQVSPTASAALSDVSPALKSPTGSATALTVLTSPREPSVQPIVENGAHPLTPRTPGTPRTPTQAGLVSTGPPIELTTAAALYGWPTSKLAVEGVAEPVSQLDFVDNRYCVFCYMVGDDTLCGRLIYTDMDQWVHVNCALWSVEVYEDDKGVLQKCQRALNRGRNIRCDGCGVLGATIGCSVSRCQRHYHFPCALDYGVAFLPNGQTCCPLPSHMNMVARKMAVRQITANKPSETPVEIAEDKQEETAHGANNYEATAAHTEINGTHNDVKEHIVDEAPTSEQQNGNVAANGTEVQQSVLPVIIPSSEPHRCLRSDMASYVPDRKRRVHTLKTKRQLCFRVGALTVHSLGHIMVGNASFHSQHALFPLGYRSTRIFWSTQVIQQRCVYECVVTSTLIEAKKDQSKQTNEESEEDQERPDVRALFKIIPSDDREHPIVAFSPDDALLTLRSRVVSLYERSNCFASSDINPMLNRSSWFSFGLVGSHFFGFGLSEIAKELEQLPHVATTGISRQAITKLLKSRKRKHDEMENDNKPDEGKPDEEPYVFTHHLPSPQAFDEAQTEIERLVQAEERARLSSGSARTDGYEPPRSHDSPMTKTARRRLNKQASSEAVPVLSASSTSTGAAAGANGTSGTTGTSGASTSGASGSSTNSGVKGSGVPMDIEHLPIAMQYRELRRRPFDERLEVRKSKIHGYGLFTKEQMAEGQMIVEYQGQMISQDVADEREKAYEEQGIGSCYMFRLDEKTIIDATRCGNLARFINHSCDPKAYARVVCVDGGNEKKIVIFAKRTIEPGDEVTYDYKFPIEDEAIRCDCSAPNCIGRMN